MIDESLMLDVNGIHIHTTMTGQGPAVLLLHGFNGQLSSWDPVWPHLVDCDRRFRLDLAGFGGSDFDVEQSFEEGGVAELRLGGVVELAGQRLGGGGETQVGEMAADALIGRVVAHDTPSISDA